MEESESDADSLANELRNAGHFLDMAHAADSDELTTALEQNPPDIVICGSGGSLPAMEQICAKLGQLDTRPVVIAIADEATEADVIRARQCGIADLVSYQHPEHLRMAFDRQVETIRLQHRLHMLEKKLRDGEARCHAMIENSSDAIAYIHDGMHVYANRPYMKLFAIDAREDIEGMPVLDMISTEQRDRFRELLKDDIESGDNATTLDIECMSPQEGRFSCTMECSPATMSGEPCTQILVRVHSSNSELEERIKTLSQKDMLTGLVNRQHFMKVLEQRISHHPHNRQRALVYLTLDNFKAIRDEAGVVASDLVLCDTASQIKKHCSEEDDLSRFGDYSFAILMQAADQDAIQLACDKLLRSIAGHLPEAGGRTFAMTASIGICAINEHTRDTQKLISYADMACEVARTSGGNQIHTHSTVVSESMEQDQHDEWDRIISDTIAHERFYLIYQPIVSLKGDTTPRYEVLLRILDENGHTILPGQFLSIAEKSGLGRDIDRWVVDNAFARLAELRTGSSTTSFYIKLSGASLTDSTMVDWITDTLQKYQLESAGVVFEISVQTAALDLRNTMSFMTAIQASGCKVALEHVGRNKQTQLLNHLPADILKIDSSLITKLASDKEAQDAVKAIIEHAKSTGKTCIAESVEDSNCLAKLWQFGMHFIQGNFIQEPAKELGYVFESEIA